VVQACVVSLQPVESELSGSITRTFGRAEPDGDEGGWVDPEAEDSIDTLSEGQIDLGHVITEELALALDPYPRAPGAEFSPPAEPQPKAEAGPFAALARLKMQPAVPRRGARNRRRT